MPEGGRVDLHFHLIPPFYREAAAAAGTGPAVGRYPDWSPELALATMDKFGIDYALTSLAQPGVQFGEHRAALLLARRYNEYASDLAARWPARFGTLGLVPMWETREAVAEIEHCLGVLKHDGICLFASYNGKFLGDPWFDPVLAALDEHAAVVFIHPALHPSSRTLDLPWPGFMMEYLFDTTRAVVNLVFGGAIVRFPRIRFVLAHAGGLVPYFAWRLSVSPMIDPRMPQITREEVFARLRRFWYDVALSPTAETFACVSGVAAPERIVFGSDWPFANQGVIAEALTAYEAIPLSGKQRAAIDRKNALALFPKLAATRSPSGAQEP